jgi:hypothetical protein
MDGKREIEPESSLITKESVGFQKWKALEVEVGRQGVRLTEQAHQSGRGAWDQVVSGRGERGEQTRPYWASPREKGAREPHRRATRERGRG